jgi:hypothetical protein
VRAFKKDSQTLARWTREKSTPWIAPKLTSSQVLGSGSVRREWKENGDGDWRDLRRMKEGMISPYEKRFDSGTLLMPHPARLNSE